jgi:opacity protein-like surface antigen
MKSFLLFSVAALALTGVASATQIVCTPQPIGFANGVGSGSVTCPSIAPDSGFNLTSVVLTLAADYLNGAFTGTNDVRVTFTPTGPGGVTWTPSSQFVDVVGGFSSGAQGLITLVASGFNNSSFSGGESVTVSSSIISGSVFKSTGNVFLTYTETSQTPEPASMGLLGSALLSLGLLRRYKK